MNSGLRILCAVVAACACAIGSRAALAQDYGRPSRGTGELRFLSEESSPLDFNEPLDLPGYIDGDPISYSYEEPMASPEVEDVLPGEEVESPLALESDDEEAPGAFDEPPHQTVGRHRQSRVRLPRWHRFMSRFLSPPIDGRHRGLGNPLERESWLNRPYHIDLFVGGLFADDPISGRIKAGDGLLVGGRLGWDLHPFWGMEGRFARSAVPLEHPGNSRGFGDMTLYFFDVNLMYYPLGDAQWRPYMGLGLGLTDVDFRSDLEERIHETAFSVPLSWGIKYRQNDRLAFRFDVLLDFAATAGNRLDATTNVGVTGGLEYHFGGGSRRDYYPWNPSRRWW